MAKRALKIVGIILLALIVVVGCYVAYVFVSYYRLDDNLVLEVEKRIPAAQVASSLVEGSELDEASQTVEAPAQEVGSTSAAKASGDEAPAGTEPTRAPQVDEPSEGNASEEALPVGGSSGEDHPQVGVLSTGECLQVDVPYSVVSYNVGFGAYSADYSFFMDGGTESRARSAQAVKDNIGGAMAEVRRLDPDFVLLQEVDVDGTRSHHVNELDLVKEDLPSMTDVVFAQNYDSPYLAWPLLEPHGANKAGQVTLAQFPITSAVRRSLPIEQGPMSLVDLDRCYSVVRFAVSSGVDEGPDGGTEQGADIGEEPDGGVQQGAGKVSDSRASTDVSAGTGAGMDAGAGGKLDASVDPGVTPVTGLDTAADNDTAASAGAGISADMGTAEVPASGRELVIYNLHLSAYTSDGTIAEEQLDMLTQDMKREYEAGNWVIAGGDFNKDLLGNSGEIFGVSGPEYTWAQPIPDRLIPEGLALIAPFEAETPIASCRNADRPYDETDYRVTVDGFIVSDNVEVEQATVVDTGFAFSDHNPVELKFVLR